MLGATAIVALASPGCGSGDGTTENGGSAGSTSDGGGGIGGTGGTGGTQMTGGGGTGGPSTGGTGGTGGTEPTDQGAQGMDLVSAGGTAKSANFSVVFTLGQSTQNQGRSKSANFTLQGGLIGGTGSLK